MLKKKHYCIYETFFYVNLMITTKKKKKIQAGIYNIQKEETERKIIESHHTKITESDKMAKKQW